MDAWMAAAAGLTRVPAGGQNAVLLDTDWATGRMVQKAVQRARRTGELPSQPPAARRHVWRLLQANSLADERLSDDPGLAAWATGLPQYRAAETARRYLPLLAHLSLALGTKVPLFDHIVVDEAQDLTPIEWSLLCEINTGDSWTLVGDMNQRHTDTSYGNWAALIAAILPDVDTKRFKPELFNRGYRSTAKIIAYANRLLPTAERKVASLQRDGAEPLVMKVRRRSRLGPAAIDLALSMLERHPQGTAGIITPDFSTVLSAMSITDGWEVVSSDPPVREREGSRLAVVTPAMARGLEFDVVVVVEPAEFQKNLGRRGQLYTSLTRANRELGVVHERPLPEALRRRGRPIQDDDDPELQSA
jgi:DNA helicase II / ATP-dependent DNA helicase PcrA